MPLYVRLLLKALRFHALLTAGRLVWRAIGGPGSRLASRLDAGQPPLSLLAALPPPMTQEVPLQAGPTDVVVHRGCVMDVLWEGTNARAVLLLREAGLGADRLPISAGCCGALHAHAGDMNTARDLAKGVITSVERSNARVLVSLAGGCGAFIAEYPHLFDENDPWRRRAEQTGQAVRDIASLLGERGWVGPKRGECVTYQDSCHLRHGLKVWREPRVLLAQTGDYREMPGADGCCGSAGVYNLVRPDVASRLLDAKVAAIQETGASTVVVTNPGCELQLRQGIRAAGLPVTVRHLVDWLWETRVQAREPTGDGAVSYSD